MSLKLRGTTLFEQYGLSSAQYAAQGGCFPLNIDGSGVVGTAPSQVYLKGQTMNCATFVKHLAQGAYVGVLVSALSRRASKLQIQQRIPARRDKG